MKRSNTLLGDLLMRILLALATAVLPGLLCATPVIVPVVQQLEQRSGELLVDSGWVIVADLSDADELFNARYLQDGLVKEFGLNLSIADATSSRARREKRIVIGKPAHAVRIAMITDKRGLQLDPFLDPEGYLLDSSEIKGKADIFVLGNQSSAVFYGIQSLLKHPNGSPQALFERDGQLLIEQFTITDWPDKSIRGALVRLSKNHDFADNLEWIDVMARLKMNMVVFGEDTSELVELDQLYAYARQRYMEPVPFLRGLNNSSFVREDVNIAEGIPAVDELFHFVDNAGIHTAEPLSPVAQVGVIANGDFETPVSSSSSNWNFTGLSHWVWDTTEFHSGAASVKLHVPELPELETVSGFVGMTTANYIPVQGGETYVISFWAKTENTGGKSLPYVRTTQFTDTLVSTPGTNRGATTIRLPRGSTGWRQYFQPVYVAEETRFLRVVSAANAGGYGTVWLDDFELSRMNGALVNVIRTETTDIRVHSQDGLTQYAENIDYRVIDGELQFGTVDPDRSHVHRFYPLHTPTQIELLSGSAINPADTVKVSYDFLLNNTTGRSSAHPSYSVNDQRTYNNHVFPYLEEMIEALDPVFSLYSGASEASAINRDSRNNGMQNYELLAKDINNVYDRLKAIDSNMKVFLWDDMMNPWHYGDNIYYQHNSGGGKIGASEPKDYAQPRITDLIPTNDVIQWVWQYHEDDNNGKRANSGNYFEGKSFQWVASTKTDLLNIEAWAREIDGRASCLGVINWTLSGFDGLEPTASYSWNNKNLTN